MIKNRLPIKQSGLPQMVIDQTPKLMRRSKLPIVKAKIGPKIMTLVADEAIFDLIPVKKEIKADVSGIYIVGVRGLRGSLTPPAKKKGLVQTHERKSCVCPEINRIITSSKYTQKSIGVLSIIQKYSGNHLILQLFFYHFLK